MVQWYPCIIHNPVLITLVDHLTSNSYNMCTEGTNIYSLKSILQYVIVGLFFYRYCPSILIDLDSNHLQSTRLLLTTLTCINTSIIVLRLAKVSTNMASIYTLWVTTGEWLLSILNWHYRYCMCQALNIVNKCNHI